MRRHFTKSLLLSGLALAGLAGAGQVASGQTMDSGLYGKMAQEYKATAGKKLVKEKISVNDITGGLDFDRSYRDFGLTPKEYGMRYGNGGSKRSNRLRYSHNAKVKRRSRHA